jgi:hypothetical protein
LVELEEKYEKARKRALQAGVLVHDDDQESGFPDYPDDGYRESFKADMAARINRSAIEQWISELGPQSSDISIHTGADSVWEARTLDVDDTFSMRADGKDRKRIDSWNVKCDEMRATLPVELTRFTILEDARIEAASQTYGRLRSFSCSV